MPRWHTPWWTISPGGHIAPKRHYAPTTLCQGGWYAPGDTLSGWAALLVYISYGPIPSYEYLDSCTFWTCVHSKRPLRDALKIARDRLKMCQSSFGTLFFKTTRPATLPLVGVWPVVGNKSVARLVVSSYFICNKQAWWWLVDYMTTIWPVALDN